MSPKTCLFLFVILLVTSCSSNVSYTLEQLENNHYNALKLPANGSITDNDFRDLFDKLSELNKDELTQILTGNNLELNEASFCFYYLANSYAREKNIEKAMYYHQLAAEQYINPQSLLKLAEWNFFKEKDFAKAYEYLHQSLEVKVEITGNNRSHPLAKNGKDKIEYMRQELEKAAQNGAFDRNSVRQKLKAELTPLVNKYREIYQLGPREGEQPS